MKFVPTVYDESDANGIIYVRQSWLGDMMTCPERARFKLVMPDMSGPSDATIMGTAVHHGIETYLNGGCDEGSIADVAYAKFLELQQTPYKETNLDPAKYEIHIRSMCQSWIEGILPHVEPGGETEYRFRVPTGIWVDNWSVWLEGTMDYVSPSGVVWDWKTASRAYNAREKQSTSLQATVYSVAMERLGKATFPTTFNFGVMIRQEKPKSQIVTVERNLAHRNWLMKHIRGAVTMGLRLGIKDVNWTMNESSNLCSEKWCSYWSVCKGAYLSPADLAVVDTPVTLSGTIPSNNEPKEG